jgi:hypothetical protein
MQKYKKTRIKKVKNTRVSIGESFQNPHSPLANRKTTNLPTDGFNYFCLDYYFNNSFTNPGVAKLAVWMSSL